MLSESSGPEWKGKLSEWQSSKKVTQCWAGSLPGLRPHPVTTLWAACTFFKHLRLLEVVLADQKHSMTSLTLSFSQHCRFSPKTVYCHRDALWLLREGENRAHDIATLLRCLIRNNIWMKWLLEVGQEKKEYENPCFDC